MYAVGILVTEQVWEYDRMCRKNPKTCTSSVRNYYLYTEYEKPHATNPGGGESAAARGGKVREADHDLFGF